MAEGTAPDTIVLIHGLWMTPESWAPWVARFKARGFKVITPAYPGLEVGVQALRTDTAPIAKLTPKIVLDHLEAVIKALERPPIIMGHSFGGAFVQLLLDRGLGYSGVGIHSAPIRGVWAVPLSAIKSTWPVLRNPFNQSRAQALTVAEFNYAFAPTLSREDAAKVHEELAIACPACFIFQGALANMKSGTVLKADFKKPNRAPLLFITGDKDNIIPPAVAKDNFSRYKTGICAIKCFKGRDHFTCGAPGWEQVADFALDWALSPSALREV